MGRKASCSVGVLASRNASATRSATRRARCRADAAMAVAVREKCGDDSRLDRHGRCSHRDDRRCRGAGLSTATGVVGAGAVQGRHHISAAAPPTVTVTCVSSPRVPSEVVEDLPRSSPQTKPSKPRGLPKCTLAMGTAERMESHTHLSRNNSITAINDMARASRQAKMRHTAHTNRKPKPSMPKPLLIIRPQGLAVPRRPARPHQRLR